MPDKKIANPRILIKQDEVDVKLRVPDNIAYNPVHREHILIVAAGGN